MIVIESRIKGEGRGVFASQLPKMMPITINLPPDLEQDLIRQAQQANILLPSFILPALRRATHRPPIADARWPEIIPSYTGNPDFPRLESCRSELLPPKEV